MKRVNFAQLTMVFVAGMVLSQNASAHMKSICEKRYDRIVKQNGVPADLLEKFAETVEKRATSNTGDVLFLVDLNAGRKEYRAYKIHLEDEGSVIKTLISHSTAGNEDLRRGLFRLDTEESGGIFRQQNLKLYGLEPGKNSDSEDEGVRLRAGPEVLGRTKTVSNANDGTFVVDESFFDQNKTELLGSLFYAGGSSSNSIPRKPSAALCKLLKADSGAVESVVTPRARGVQDWAPPTTRPENRNDHLDPADIKAQYDKDVQPLSEGYNIPTRPAQR